MIVRAPQRPSRELASPATDPFISSQLKYQVSKSSKALAYSRVVGEPDRTGKYTANSARHPAVNTARAKVASRQEMPPGKVSRRVNGPRWYSSAHIPHRAATKKGTAVK